MTLQRVHVVVPAHDEEDLLPACLAALAVARTRLAVARPDLTSAVTVVLDACGDGSAEVCRRAGVDVVAVAARSVGAARAAGVRRVAEQSGDPDRVWVATTDADSRVPTDWLVAHVALAEAGAALVAGTVVPDPADLALGVAGAWHALHLPTDGHDHVHGANLGFSLAAYTRAGGFGPDPVHEDVRLVAAVRALGLPVAATASLPVVTSGRLTGRAPDGFAAYLAGLSA